ncbi:hypothetical protein FQR65_LT01010 [Abscondita terminalis]|nr:hypothetical protein FQR65_LT01010 [Abscondita terminalis]
MVRVLYLIIVIHYLCSSIHCAYNCTEVCTCFGDVVDCSQQKLKDVPLNIPILTTHMNLNYNRIKSFNSRSFQNLTKLAELRLYNNKIKVIPKGAFDTLKKLKILDFSRNQLQAIEALTFKSSEKLTTLRLRNNRISQLKDGVFYGLSKMKFLLLDHNSIEVISKGWLYGLSNLKVLKISHNVIKDIYKDAWEDCKDLIQLDLSFNQIKSIEEDTFKHLNILQNLNLNNNNIAFIKEGAFEHLKKLNVLQLNNNHISWAIEDADGVFFSLNNLMKLYLKHNNIKSINMNAFRGLINIDYLDLTHNNITTIQENAFSEMPGLQQLLLNTSALLCDCNLEWFYNWLRPERFLIETICWYPEQLRGISLLEVDASNFTCDDLPKPRLIEEPELEIMALKGENISLTCKAMSSADGPMNFTWKKDNIELINADVNVVATTYDAKNIESTSILNLYKVKNSDAGKYQCIVSNDFGSTYSLKSCISVLIFPTFVKIPQNVTVRAGSTARLECAAYGEPLPEIAWQKDGGNNFPAARERRMHVMPTDDVFFIVNAKPSDIGIYSCTANNAAGTIIANASLTMEDDGPIHATERHFFTAEDQLMIIVDTILTDTGTYQCKLNNSLGTVIDYSEVNVKPDISSDNQLMGIIIISVVCCAVLTSIVWVVIIYQTRIRMATSSIVSMPVIDSQAADVIDKALTQFADDSSEHSPSKDSGTGNSRKHSEDDLISADEYKLFINCSTGYTCDSNNSPLLHKDDISNPTNHRRMTYAENLDKVDAKIVLKMENEPLDEFAFSGPLTLTKIRKILSIETPSEQINRRATLEVSQPSRTIYSDSPTTDCLIRMQLHDKEEYELNSSFIDQYLKKVPNDNLTDGESSKFIEQLSEALELNDTEPEHDSVITISDDEEFQSQVQVEKSSETEENEKVILVDDEDLHNSLVNTSVFEVNEEQQSEDRQSELKVEKSNATEQNENMTFDDTFNEIEMALKYGLDYSIPGDDVSVSSNGNGSVSEINQPAQALVVDSMPGNCVSEVNFPSEDNLMPSGSSDIIASEINKPSVVTSKDCHSSSEKNLKHDAKDFVFKQPTPKPSSSNTRNFKNVVSPVGVYIRSLRSPIMRTAKNSNAKTLFVSEEPVINVKKSNEVELPKVIYKPPRRVITATESSIKLPSNIKKILPSPITVIKHEGRLRPVATNKPEINEQLLHDDLSIGEDLSRLNNSSLPESLDDVSFHRSKNIFIS